MASKTYFHAAYAESVTDDNDNSYLQYSNNIPPASPSSRTSRPYRYTPYTKSDTDDNDDFIPKRLRRAFSKSADAVLETTEPRTPRKYFKSFRDTDSTLEISDNRDGHRDFKDTVTREETLSRIKLKHKDCVSELQKVTTVCTKKDEMEFQAVARQLEDNAFKLTLWAMETNLEDMENFSPTEGESIRLAEEILDRCCQRIRKLGTACQYAESGELDLLESYDCEFEPMENNSDDESIRSFEEYVLTLLLLLLSPWMTTYCSIIAMKKSRFRYFYKT